jgi:hypothetical protein
MEAYLAQRGDLCIARQSWPVDVTENDRALRTRDAVQMPVFERLGVVGGHQIKVRAATEAGETVVVPVTRYELTDSGRQSYIDRRSGRPVAPRADADPQADLCVARLSLDKVVGWEASLADRQPMNVIVSYTYKVDAVPWVRDPEALRVLPAIARVIAGAGTAELKQGLVSTGGGWVANELARPSAPVAARTGVEGGRP